MILRELIITASFLLALSGIMAGLLVIEKSYERINNQAVVIMEKANEIN